MSGAEQVETMAKVFRRANDPIDKKNPELRRIWSEITEHNASAQRMSKVNVEKVRCQRQDVHRYLLQRYNKHMTHLIMQAFKFPPSFKLQEYCERIETWIF